MAQLAPTAAGFYSQWNGAFTDIDEVGIADSLFIDTPTANNISTFDKTTVPSALDSGYEVVAIGIVAKAKRGAGGPQNLQLVCRSGTTDGVSSTIALDLGYENHRAVFATDPNTASAWTFANLDACEIGVKAIT
jgi:hypothetical protein